MQNEIPKDIRHCVNVKSQKFGNLTVWMADYEYKPFPEAPSERTRYRLLTEGSRIWLKIYTGTLYGSLDHKGSVSADHPDAEECWTRWDPIKDFDKVVREARKLGSGLVLSEYKDGKSFVLTKS